jgi:hypothetical protein
MDMKSEDKFYLATDLILDSNKKMSVCRDCIKELYIEFFNSEHSMEKAVLRLCRMLNIVYNQRALDATRQSIETSRSNGREIESPFGIYRNKIAVTQGSQLNNQIDQDLTYQDSPQITIVPENIGDDLPNLDELKDFWGDNLTPDDYMWLEGEANQWRKKHKIDTRAEESLLQMIVLKLFAIRKARSEGHPTSSLEKEYQEMLKTSALAPSMTSSADSGENLDTFGKWIEEIEKYEPAVWLKNEGHDDLYKDVGNVDEYFQKYFVRPLKNFMLQSKDFIGDGEGDIDMDEVSDEIEKEEVNANTSGLSE